VCLAVVVACSGDPAPATDADPTEPSEPTVDLEALSERGPLSAGSREVDITGSTGTPLKVQLWYPTAIPDADLFYDGIIPGRAALDADVLCDEVRGLVAFSHGYGGTRVQSPFLTEHLASHGFVVVSPDHTGNTLFDLDTVPYAEVLVRRPVDVADSVDAALDELGPCLDEADGYVVMGHSFGGYTALAVAGATVNPLEGGTADLSDPRVRGAIGLAPWDAAGGITDGTAMIEVPTMILTGARDATTPLSQVERLYDPLTVEPRWLGTLADGGHYTFSPIACSVEVGDGCGADYLPPEVAVPLINGAVAAFVEGVRGTSGAFDAVAVDAPEVAWTSAP
jgi:predicted dienelactone hydrolase